MTNTKDEHDRTLEEIAHTQLGIRTLDTRNADRLDFHEVAVWRLKTALATAYSVGQKQATASTGKMADALRVIALDPAIRDWLQTNDPKALEQVRNALAEIGTTPAGICPRCGEADHDKFVWDDDGSSVTCQTCGTNFAVHPIG